MIIAFSYAQENFKFTHVSKEGDGKAVKFGLVGFKDEIHKEEVVKKLRADENITKFVIKSDNSCYAIVNEYVDEDYIYYIVSPLGIDFARKYAETINKKSMKLPLHYPERAKADGKKIDDVTFQKALEFWKKRYPKEWEEYKKSQNLN